MPPCAGIRKLYGRSGADADWLCPEHFLIENGRKVYYEFATYAGAGIKGSYGPVHGKSALPVGTPLVVLYDRDNPKRNTRYPPGLVTLDY